MAERYVKRQALSNEEIHALSDEALVAALPAQKKQEVLKMTRGFFDSSMPKKRDDETTGQYRERCREGAEANDRELARSLRENFEGALYESQQEKRLMDALMLDHGNPEYQKENEEREKRLAADDRRHEEADGPILRPKGWPSGAYHQK